MTHFSIKEQACPCCQVTYLAPGFLDALDELREACGHAMPVNSMCRCEKHNEAVGGREGSYHLITKPWGTCAADISTVGWPGWKKHAFTLMAMRRDFSVGRAKSFIHLDMRSTFDPDWPKPVEFLY